MVPTVEVFILDFFVGLAGSCCEGLPTPPAAALILYKVSAPTLFTASLVNTNSPGVNIAGTVSVFPWPGTSPP